MFLYKFQSAPFGLTIHGEEETKSFKLVGMIKRSFVFQNIIDVRSLKWHLRWTKQNITIKKLYKSSSQCMPYSSSQQGEQNV